MREEVARKHLLLLATCVPVPCLTYAYFNLSLLCFPYSYNLRTARSATRCTKKHSQKLRSPRIRATSLLRTRPSSSSKSWRRQAILKMRDPKIAIADKLSSLDGANAYNLNAEEHAATLGAHNVNDAVEGNFGRFDHVLHRFRGVSTESASGVAQQLKMHDFDEGDMATHRKGNHGVSERRAVGYFYTLPRAEQEAAVRAGMQMRAGARIEARRDLAEQQAYFRLKREQASQKQLAKLVAEYTKAMAAFDKYSAPGRAAPTLAAVHARLKKLSSAASQHAYLREQIEMRVLGLGLAEHAISWSLAGAQRSNEELFTVLHNMLKAEAQLRTDGALPTEAVPPRMRPKNFKKLGSPTADAEELMTVDQIDASQLRSAADAARTANDEELVTDAVQDRQPSEPPPFDAWPVGHKIEVRWCYHLTPTSSAPTPRFLNTYV
uniref:Uncharacterized protein n=1 Tax=Chrysotila carterae TaxID=13221 RepID=A0A6S9ZF86_CHRCT